MIRDTRLMSFVIHPRRELRCKSNNDVRDKRPRCARQKNLDRRSDVRTRTPRTQITKKNVHIHGKAEPRSFEGKNVSLAGVPNHCQVDHHMPEVARSAVPFCYSRIRSTPLKYISGNSRISPEAPNHMVQHRYTQTWQRPVHQIVIRVAIYALFCATLL